MAAGHRAFKAQADFRAWLEQNHAREKELVVRLFKVHAKDRGIGHREALDEALCFGWIDGVVHSLDDHSFTIRFTPRKAKSKWSAVNIKRFKELQAAGKVRPPGLAAFASYDGKGKPYSYEARPTSLAPRYERQLRANKQTWVFWSDQPPGYKRLMAFYVMGAKREETRDKRFARLLDHTQRGVRIPVMEKYRGGRRKAGGGR